MGLKVTSQAGSQYGQTLASAGAVTFDASKGSSQQVTLGANCSSSSIANPPAASGATQDLTLVIQQDATGGRTFTPPANIKWAGGTAPTWSTLAGYTDIVRLVYVRGATNYWMEVSRSIGVH